MDYKIGDWVFVRFPEEETGKHCKMSRPCYSPFRIVAQQGPNLRVSKVYFPEDLPILVHELRVFPSPDQLPAGFFWYGARRRSPGHVPNWLQRMLAETATQDCIASTITPESEESEENGRDSVEPDETPQDSPSDHIEAEAQEYETLVPEWLEQVEQESSEPDIICESGPGRYNLRNQRKTRKPVHLRQNCTTEQFKTN